MNNYKFNEMLSDAKSGNYLLKVTSIGDKRRSNFCSYEYYVTVKYKITDTLNEKREEGPVVPGFGPNPIDLNTNREEIFVFYDFWDHDKNLFKKLLDRQTSINEEGYYPKERK